MMYKYIVLIALVTTFCDGGQITDTFFPDVTQTAREFVDGISKTHLVTLTTKVSGDIFAMAADMISRGPAAVVRALGIGDNILPVLVSDKNLVDSVDKYVTDFNIGLGNEDAHLPFSSIVSKYGYPFEEHEIVTEDGYVLSVFRIPGNGPVAFLMHGLLGSADDYITAGPENGLAYLLANEGYDVWMGNARGNKHSRRHVKLTPSDASFWEFSWHEIGFYDLPAMIDYVLGETKQSSVKYIGHSQGTTTFFVMASERPEYNDHISLMIALSPVAFMSKVKSPMVRLLAPGTSLIHSFAQSIGVYEFLPDDGIIRIMKSLMCGVGAISEIVCSNVIFLIAGFGFAQQNFTNLPVFMGHMPSGSSTMQFAHYGQGVISGDFRKFDYGIAGNLEKYGTKIPPSYPLYKITAPVALFYSDEDWLAHPNDVGVLYKKLNNTIDIFKIPFTPFNHLDFLWGKDFKALVYQRVRKLLNSF